MRWKQIEGFLTPEECQYVIALARPRLEQSTTWDIATASRKRTDFRTSEFMFFQARENQLIKDIEDRIHDLVGYPVENGEALQVAYYKSNTDYFKAHCDSFDPAYSGNEQMIRLGGQRDVTAMVYLNDVPAGYGGETVFPHENLRVRPETGKLLMWRNILEDGKVDNTTLHSAEPVREPYTKWIFTRWIRSGRFG